MERATLSYYGVFIIAFFSIVERIGLKNILKKSKPIAWLYSFFVINMGWVIFKITDIGQLKKFVKGL